MAKKDTTDKISALQAIVMLAYHAKMNPVFYYTSMPKKRLMAIKKRYLKAAYNETIHTLTKLGTDCSEFKIRKVLKDIYLL